MKIFDENYWVFQVDKSNINFDFCKININFSFTNKIKTKMESNLHAPEEFTANFGSKLDLYNLLTIDRKNSFILPYKWVTICRHIKEPALTSWDKS